MTTPPLKPTKTLSDVLERIKARLPEGPALPKPITDEAPPPPWSDTDTHDEEAAP